MNQQNHIVSPARAAAGLVATFVGLGLLTAFALADLKWYLDAGAAVLAFAGIILNVANFATFVQAVRSDGRLQDASIEQIVGHRHIASPVAARQAKPAKPAAKWVSTSRKGNRGKARA